MIYYYAFLNDQDIVEQIVSLPSLIDLPNYIRIDSYDESLIGKRYNRETGEFEDVIVLEGGKRYATVVIGTAASGHSAEEVDFLCTGIRDNAKFVEALNAIGSGGKLIVREGNYNLEDTVTVKANVTVEGMGRATVLRSASQGVGYTLLTGTGSNIFAKMRLVGSAEVNGIRSAAETTIEDVEFEDFSVGVILGNFNALKSCRFKQCSVGIGMDSAVSNSVLAGNQLTKCNKGIDSVGARDSYRFSNCSLSDNKFYDSAMAVGAIGIRADFSSSSITGNYILTRTNGIVSDAVSDSTFTSNSIELEYGADSAAAFDIGKISGSTIVGNRFTSIGQYKGKGINLPQGTGKHTSVINNNFIKGFHYGIFIEGYAETFTINGNSVDECSEGIYVKDVAGFTIDGNSLHHCSTGIHLGDEAVRCTITSNCVSTLLPNSSYPRYSILLDSLNSENLITGNKVAGVNITDLGSSFSNNTITNNKFTNL